MLLLVFSCFVACGDKDKEEESTTVATTVVRTGDGGFTDTVTRENAQSSLPEGLNFGGITIRYLARNREDTSFEISPEMVADEGLSDAVYNRNKKVEQTLGITLEPVLKAGNFAQKAEYMSEIRNNANGPDYYDIISGPNYALVPLSLEGYFTNIHSLDYIDTDAAWWNGSFVDECTYQDRLYTIQGELALSMIDSAFVMYFNKTMFESEYPDKNLYDMVNEGDWTFEEFKKLVVDIHTDSGTKSGEKDSGDIFGYVSPSFACGRDGYPTAFGATVAEKDANGNISFTFDKQRNYDIWGDFYDMLQTSNGVYVNGADDAARTGAQEMFQSSKAMFITELLHYSLSLRATDVDYGVVPLPKYDDAQENYRTSSESVHSQFAIMNAGTQRTEASAVLEALCFETYKSVTMEYFQTTLKFKNMKDPESTQMLDLIVDTITLDFGAQFASSLQWPYPVIGTEENLASYFGSKQSQLKPFLDSMLNTLATLDS